MTNKEIASNLAIALSLLAWSAASAVVLMLSEDIMKLIFSPEFLGKFFLASAVHTGASMLLEARLQALLDAFRPKG